MKTPIVVIENPKEWKATYPAVDVVAARDYLGQSQYLKERDLKVVNLCRSYTYQTQGYYTSLLAQARRHRVIPTVRTLNDLRSKAIYSLQVEDLDAVIQKSLKTRPGAAGSDRFELLIFFGQCGGNGLQELARQIFDLFQCPLLRVEFRYQGKWDLASIRYAHLHQLTPEQEALFIEAFQNHMARRWKRPRTKNQTRYDLAVLHNPSEALPPSNKRALQKFVRVGEKMGIGVDLIERKDYAKLAEYDGLFIRETTQIEHHTYRFAKKAESEGLVVIDDPDSIMKCTNKVYLDELLKTHRVATPRTRVIQGVALKTLRALEAEIPYPMVLKIPDSSFSRGVHKVNNFKELKETAKRLFEDSDLILAQEYLYTPFDWRIGVLNRRPIFACRYFMSKKHWQIVKHSPSGRFVEGDADTVPVEEAPARVVQTAVKAAGLIGDGLYGVDLKQAGRRVVVMEVNDNPNLDAGVEDACLGDQLYRIVLEEFVRRIELQLAQ